MRIIKPGVGPGRTIDLFESTGAEHLGTARFEGSGALSFLHLSPGTRLGRHPAVLVQLYCVVHGTGWVRGSGERITLTAGQAALWEPGEEHESGSETGMTVAVLEATSINA
jgi:quercetin dioxygenase-like cupin family protein